MLSWARKSARWLLASMYGHLSLWMHSLRTILAAIFIFLMTYMLTKSTESMCSIYQFEIHLGELMYHYANRGFHIINTSVGLLVLLSELPKRISYQNYTMIRLSRRKWLVSLVAFCMGIILVFTLLMLASSAILSLPFVTPGSGWSDLERLAADPDYVYEIQFAAEYIRILSPTVACALAALIVYLFWLTMAFVIMFFSLCGAPNFGVILCVFVLLSNIIILFESLPGLKLPSQFATLSVIAGQVYDNKLQFVGKAIIGYLIIDALLLALMMSRVRKMDVRFMGKE